MQRPAAELIRWGFGEWPHSWHRERSSYEASPAAGDARLPSSAEGTDESHVPRGAGVAANAARRKPLAWSWEAAARQPRRPNMSKLANALYIVAASGVSIAGAFFTPQGLYPVVVIQEPHFRFTQWRRVPSFSKVPIRRSKFAAGNSTSPSSATRRYTISSLVMANRAARPTASD